MIVIFILCLALMISSALFALFFTDSGKSPIAWLAFAIMFICTLSIMGLSDPPKAIDVYRGKTELKVTYEDSIPVDTVVIYKKGDSDV